MARKSKERLVTCKSAMEGEVIPKVVVGSTGRTYRCREIVCCSFPPGLFGTRGGGHVRHTLCTLHNGLLNQCSIKGNLPTPYWAILDAAIDLRRGFERKDVVDKAVRIVGEAKRSAAEMAWDVLRNHHRHDRKKNSGMVYMIEDGNDGKLLIRARDVGETLQYFEGQVGRRKEAEALVAQAAEASAGG